jgi:heme oxygenase (biliverdin-producing, ferredoxin)
VVLHAINISYVVLQLKLKIVALQLILNQVISILYSKMGTILSTLRDVLKKIVPLSSPLIESESRSIHKATKANKIPGSLSLQLDGVLKKEHDMKAFGLGTLASMASRSRYARFTQSMYHVYSAMEEELDQLSSSQDSVLHELWQKHASTLRRAPSLAKDLQDVLTPEEWTAVQSQPPTMGPTADYVRSIRRAGSAHSPHTLIGHLYCRYLADLFGGSVLGTPYNLALGLPSGTPRHFCFEQIQDRRAFIETLYTDINACGAKLSEKQQQEVVEEAVSAFRHNAHVYTEEPIYWDSVKAWVNISTGLIGSLFKKETKSIKAQ